MAIAYQAAPGDSSEPRLLKSIDVLLKEYELHRVEILRHLDHYHYQATFLQVFFTANVTVMLAYLPSAKAADTQQPQSFLKALSNFPMQTFFLLFCAALVAWYLLASIGAMHHTIRVIRERMITIESQVNSLASATLLTYETSIVRSYISPFVLPGQYVNPISVPIVFRSLLLMATIILLGFVSRAVLPVMWHLLYTLLLLIGSYYIAFVVAKQLLVRSVDLSEPADARSWLSRRLQEIPVFILILIAIAWPNISAQFHQLAIVDQLRNSLEFLSATLTGSLAFSFFYSFAAYVLPPFSVGISYSASDLTGRLVLAANSACRRFG